MKRIVYIIIAVLLLGIFIWLALNKDTIYRSKALRQSAKTVLPSATKDDSALNDLSAKEDSFNESNSLPLIPLEADELFLQALNIDLNNDGALDQICAIKKTSETHLLLILGLQNPATGEFIRVTSIKTGVTQSRTLLFYTMDIIGDRTNALIYSGITEENIQVLGVFLPSVDKDAKMQFIAVADLRADGSIAIQETQRSAAYEAGYTNGESFSIVTYNSDSQISQNLDQIERVYTWDKNLFRYIQQSETKIAGKKVESSLMRQLQSGDMDSFKNFLDGLWYKPSSVETGTKSIFYNKLQNEFLFHFGVTQEVYIIETIVPRRYGIYLTTRNNLIPSMRRLIDIELTGTDEIRIKILEDVKLKISVASDWDGVYRKMAEKVSVNSSNGTILSEIKKIFVNPVRLESETGEILTIENDMLTIKIVNSEEKGRYTTYLLQNNPILQINGDSTSAKSKFYKIDLDDTVISLTEVAVSTNGLTLKGGQKMVFKRP